MRTFSAISLGALARTGYPALAAAGIQGSTQAIGPKKAIATLEAWMKNAAKAAGHNSRHHTNGPVTVIVDDIKGMRHRIQGGSERKNLRNLQEDPEVCQDIGNGVIECCNNVSELPVGEVVCIQILCDGPDCTCDVAIDGTECNSCSFCDEVLNVEVDCSNIHPDIVEDQCFADPTFPGEGNKTFSGSLFVDDPQERADPDFKSLNVSYDGEMVWITINFHEATILAESGNFLYMYEENNHMVSFSNQNFEVRLDPANDGHFEQTVYAAPVGWNSDEEMIMEIPIDVLPDIARKRIWAYSMTSLDRIPDFGEAEFIPPMNETNPNPPDQTYDCYYIDEDVFECCDYTFDPTICITQWCEAPSNPDDNCGCEVRVGEYTCEDCSFCNNGNMGFDCTSVMGEEWQDYDVCEDDDSGSGNPGDGENGGNSTATNGNTTTTITTTTTTKTTTTTTKTVSKTSLS
mmetsp:Transcript_18723/g.38006  ORF Transcript_18723/g.38006 Transcript_18723/m.38006 type:complete len:460 (-) Transcript_18723:183-1562(-)